MTVTQLIELLQRCDPRAEILVLVDRPDGSLGTFLVDRVGEKTRDVVVLETKEAG